MSINAQQVYVRAENTGDPIEGERVDFTANDVTLRAFGVPFFYLPVAGGSTSERPSALREIGVGNAHALGFEALTQWIRLPIGLRARDSKDILSGSSIRRRQRRRGKSRIGLGGRPSLLPAACS